MTHSLRAPEQLAASDGQHPEKALHGLALAGVVMACLMMLQGIPGTTSTHGAFSTCANTAAVKPL